MGRVRERKGGRGGEEGKGGGKGEDFLELRNLVIGEGREMRREVGEKE